MTLRLRPAAVRTMRVGSLVAPLALLGWYWWTYRDAEVLGLPTLLLWAFVMAAGAFGLAIQARASRIGRPVTRAAAGIGAALVGGSLVVAGTTFVGPSSSGQALAATFVLGAAAGGGGYAIGRLGSVRLSPATLLAAQALAMWAVVDIGAIQRDVHLVDGDVQVYLLYDFHTYLNAGRNFMSGEPVYLQQALTTLPDTTHQEHFLYPPVLLPAVAALASIPRELAAGAFVAALVLAAVLGLRLLGMRWSWALLLLSFPPLFKGLLSGNVASIGFLLYVAAPAVGALAVLGASFKVQSALPALWLARAARWRDLAIGMAALLLLVLITLPLVGVESWTDYVRGLSLREQSQHNLPVLFGSSLLRYMPVAAFVAVSAAAVLAALVPGGRRSLALIGIATIVASPSLWPHGFVMALPAALSLPPVVLWLTLGLTIGGGAQWLLPVVAAVSAFVDWDRLRPADPVDPMGGTRGPWGRTAPDIPEDGHLARLRHDGGLSGDARGDAAVPNDGAQSQ